ncbi:MAG: polyphosphate kinase 1 [Gemmatimonadaceae bacterium]|nr:polyphosphate kinase 1 [Gemmatimonadaceae bacterium]
MKRPLPTFRYEVRSARHLDELVASPLPLGMVAGDARRSQHRDLYLDTSHDTLRRRNITCRFRLRSDDTRILSVRIGSAGSPSEVRFDSAVRSAEAGGAVAEATAAGRRLSALIDPALLVVRLDIETERITRIADFDWLRRPRVEIHYDRSVIRRNGASGTMYQMCVHARRGDGATTERLATALEQTQQLRRESGDSRDRAELMLRWKQGGGVDDNDRSPEEASGVHAGPRSPGNPVEFLNPEIGLLDFQGRVLALAESADTPLRERLRFLSIVSSNIDEFFMIRIAGLRRAAREQSEEQCDDGLSRTEQLRLIAERMSNLAERQARCAEACLRELEPFGVRVVRWKSLDAAQRASLREECREEIHPGLTPMAMTLSPGHPLPHLPHLTLALAVVQRDNVTHRLHLAELELPADSPRFLPVPGSSGDYIAIEEVVRSNIDLLYPAGGIEGVYVFRVTRGGELSLDEESAEDLIDAVADATERRSSNPAVRVEVEREMPGFVRDLLLGNLRREDPGASVELDASDIHEIDGLLDLRCLSDLELPDNPTLRYPPFQPAEPLPEGQSLLDALRESDMLFHHPFDSFDGTVVRFLREASEDPEVTTIKITLYRIGNSSPVVDALIDAARNGKKVVAFVELKARFDEGHNVRWARKLEKAGGHVISGLVGYKNHAKALLVVRRENGKLRSYVHVGTGNYNSRSGMEYTDLSLFSSRDELTADVADLFNALTGGSLPPMGLSRGSLVAPHQMPDSIVALIDREAAHARAGRPARITAKLNGLSDAAVVRALLRASADGAIVELACRGICTLRPGVPGRSDRVRVSSVVGRFLEHSRIYRFENGGSPIYFVGSADLRHRNLRRRVELLVRVVETKQQEELDRILDLYINDATAWELGADGAYVQRRGGTLGAQEALMHGAVSAQSGT